MRLFTIILIIFGILFVVYPELDLQIAGFFYNPETGFYPKYEGVGGFIYRAVYWLMRIIVASLLICLGYSLYKKRNYKPVLFLILALAIGPGIMVNAVFKEHWGRARPAQVQEFGGEKKFTPVYQPTNQCESNCSFASGHASAGFYLMVFGFLYGGRKRTLIISGGIVTGLLVGWIRIMQGGHFFSDVIAAGLITYFCAWVLWRWLARSIGDTDNTKNIA